MTFGLTYDDFLYCESIGIIMPNTQPHKEGSCNNETAKIGMKFDTGKIEWDLMPIEAMEEVIQVMMYGSKKYAKNNWKFVEDHKVRYYNAAMRHLFAWQNGQTSDPETGFNHLAHAMCCILFLLARKNEDQLKDPL